MANHALSSHPAICIFFPHINYWHILCHHIYECHLRFSSLNPASKILLQHPSTNILTVPPHVQTDSIWPPLLCLQYFWSVLVCNPVQPPVLSTVFWSVPPPPDQTTSLVSLVSGEPSLSHLLLLFCWKSICFCDSRVWFVSVFLPDALPDARLTINLDLGPALELHWFVYYQISNIVPN